MKSKSDDEELTSRTKSDLLRQSEIIEQDIKQAAGELTLINKALRKDDRTNVSVQEILKAIEQNEFVEDDVANAADDLKQLNLQMAEEIVENETAQSELVDTKIDLAEVRADLLVSQANEKEARDTALVDSLTGIPNRASFEQALEQGLALGRRHGWRLAVLFIDVDHFKTINDSYGHDQGDNVLRMVAKRLQSFIRQEDSVCRWGGDEFVCLLSNVKQETDVIRLAEMLVGQIAEAHDFNGTLLSVRTSIGIAIFPEDGETMSSLLKNADTAMFKSKGTKKRVVLLREVHRD